MQRPLKDRQLWDAFFMSAMGRSANFSVPGSGKTASVLGTFAYLHERDLVDRIIVLSPKNAFGSWRDEWAACFGADRPLRSLCFHDPEFRGRSTRDKYSTLLLSLIHIWNVTLAMERLSVCAVPWNSLLFSSRS